MVEVDLSKRIDDLLETIVLLEARVKVLETLPKDMVSLYEMVQMCAESVEILQKKEDE